MDPQGQRLGGQVAHQAETVLPTEVGTQPINRLLFASNMCWNRSARLVGLS
jgi:hypothetical protein